MFGAEPALLRHRFNTMDKKVMAVQILYASLYQGFHI